MTKKIKLGLTYLVILSFLGITTIVFAQRSNEKKLLKKAKNLTYEGQVKYAKDLLKKGKTPTQKTDAGSSGVNSMIFNLICGSIGTGFFIYGKKQARYLFLLCGIGLCVVPMVIPFSVGSVCAGIAMLIAPFKFEL